MCAFLIESDDRKLLCLSKLYYFLFKEKADYYVELQWRTQKFWEVKSINKSIWGSGLHFIQLIRPIYFKIRVSIKQVALDMLVEAHLSWKYNCCTTHMNIWDQFHFIRVTKSKNFIIQKKKIKAKISKTRCPFMIKS